LFRQARLLDWPPVFERMAAELTKMVPPDLRARSIGVRVSPGELLDRMAELELECECVEDASNQRAARAEHAQLQAIRDGRFPPSPALDALAVALRAAVRELRAAEAAMRECERAGTFDDRFIEHARTMARASHCRAALRERVNALEL
jgi:hypothetical protein